MKNEVVNAWLATVVSYEGLPSSIRAITDAKVKLEVDKAKLEAKA